MIRFPKRSIEANLNDLDDCCRAATGENPALLDAQLLEEQLARSYTETQRLYKIMASDFRWNDIELSDPADGWNRYLEAHESE